jgi:hypothetical protein
VGGCWVVIPRCEAGIGMNYERYLEEICKYAFFTLSTVSLTVLISPDCL